LGTGFYGSNDPTDSVKAQKKVGSSPKDRLQSYQVHFTMLHACNNTYTEMNLSTVKWAQSKTKPIPENC